jgi:NADPH:quinone reductase-like Zn-dependent oxidoreductase
VRAVVLHSHGGPEVLTLEEVDEPAMGPEEVLVDIRATALNRAVAIDPRAKDEIPSTKGSLGG